MVNSGTAAPAQLPPPGLHGLEASWSRLVDVPQLDSGRTFHVLDTHNQLQGASAELTLLCVHGNPSWSYLWRHLVAAVPPGVRVVALDHLDMGFSERTGTVRRLQQRVDDLCALTDVLELTGPVVTVAHDWGGPISLGWAQRHLDQVKGVVLCNTAVHQPAGSPAPSLIRAARTPGMLRRVTVDTTTFIQGAFAMSRPRPTSEAQQGFLAPYLDRHRRNAIADFVEDIPLKPSHPSATTLDRIAADTSKLASTPTLLVWGAKDRVFSDLYLHDLETRLPHAQVHRFANAAHFVTEDADVATVVVDWLGQLGNAVATPEVQSSAETSALAQPFTVLDGTVAVREMTDQQRSITFEQLEQQVQATAAGLVAQGVKPGDRVALMIPPGVDLVVVLYACWRMGAVAVLVDAALGPSGMSAAMKSAAPQYLVGIARAVAVARSLRWPGTRILAGSAGRAQSALMGIASTLAELQQVGAERLSASSHEAWPLPTMSHEAAVVFTSGSTGPSKGVRYTHAALLAQRDAIVDLYNITGADRLVAAFAPFALYGPAMGITSVVPDMDVTAPATLSGEALERAVQAVEATLVFASPAALRNVVSTKPENATALAGVRLVMSAGAPVATDLLRSASALFTKATLHTPYGMTEALPVASISLSELDQAESELRSSGRNSPGVCVGRPLPSVSVQIRPLDELGNANGMPTDEPNVSGEVLVRAPHARLAYDRLWHTTHLASQPEGWHATGDVGHLDTQGRLWISGRVAHVVSAASGPVPPVGLEHQIQRLPDVALAAVVGVGPVGNQQLVAVVEGVSNSKGELAPLDLIDQVRSVVNVAAVLRVPKLPVDKRHNSKIDRTRVARWAQATLAGESAKKL